jgi:DtxR family transcriptional regulator, Mn-dependent transcriptional regulator
MKSRLSANMEMYLKTILELESSGQPARVNAIAGMLHVKKPSVSGALRALKAKGLVRHQSYGAVELSQEGRAVAEEVSDRYQVLQRFLTEVLQVEQNETSREACRIEHVLSPETTDRLRLFLDFLGRCNLDLNQLLEHFQEYLKWRMAGGHCPECEAAGSECAVARQRTT